MTCEAKQGGSAGCFAHLGEEDEPVVVVVLAQDRDSFRLELRMEDALRFGRAISEAADALKVQRQRWDLDQQIMDRGGEE